MSDNAHRRGPPVKLNRPLTEEMCKALLLSAPIKICCQHVGIDTTTYNKWCRIGQPLSDARNRGEAITEEDTLYADFYDMTEKAISTSVLSNLSTIKVAAQRPGAWLPAAWILERTRPEEFALQQRIISEEQPHALTKDDITAILSELEKKQAIPCDVNTIIPMLPEAIQDSIISDDPSYIPEIPEDTQPVNPISPSPAIPAQPAQPASRAPRPNGRPASVNEIRREYPRDPVGVPPKKPSGPASAVPADGSSLRCKPSNGKGGVSTKGKGRNSPEAILKRSRAIKAAAAEKRKAAGPPKGKEAIRKAKEAARRRKKSAAKPKDWKPARRRNGKDGSI